MEAERERGQLNLFATLYLIFAILIGVLTLLSLIQAIYIDAQFRQFDRSFSENGGVSSGGNSLIQWFGIAMGVFGLGISLLLFLTSFWLRGRKNLKGCQIVAVLTCASFPLGTALGVFTFLHLQKPGVRALFRR